MEAFSDGVIAIIITIMVLELKVPHGDDIKALEPLRPVFLSYLLSFINVGIYWNNHHHMLHSVKMIDGASLWMNLHLLFWLSMIPFTTAWMGENHFAQWPVAVYAFVLCMAGVAYFMLAKTLTSDHVHNQQLKVAIGRDWKGKTSIIIYLSAIGFSFLNTSISLILIAAVAAMWFIPDRRIERNVHEEI